MGILQDMKERIQMHKEGEKKPEGQENKKAESIKPKEKVERYSWSLTPEQKKKFDKDFAEMQKKWKTENPEKKKPDNPEEKGERERCLF